MLDPILTPCRVLASLSPLPATPAKASGVTVSAREQLALASVASRRMQMAPLASRVRERFGIELPLAPYRVSAGDMSFIATGLGTWLATHEQAGYEFANSLEQAIGEFASISEQSSGYVVLRLSGPKLYDTLAKLLPIDLHPGEFSPGRAASTLAAHMPVTVWRLEDSADRLPQFDFAVARSFISSFWHALSQSATEFGLVIA